MITELLALKLSYAQIAKVLGICRTSLYKKMNEYRINYKEKYSIISDNELDNTIKQIYQDQHKMGEVMLMGHLRSKGIDVQRKRVREAIHRVDPVGVEERKANGIKRRVYEVPHPNFIWHIDGNHKLIRYRLVIHCAIDGYSRLITFLQCSDNNRSQTVVELFNEATNEFGMPKHVRTDHGGENVGIWTTMYNAYGDENNPVFTSRSVHNQRAERNNRDLNVSITSPFKKVFEELELEGHLNVDNETDIFCLHYVYLPRINRALTNHTNAHNHHKISSEGSATPLQLFTVYMPWPSFHGGELNDPTQDDWAAELPETSVVTVPRVQSPLSAANLHLLQTITNPLATSSTNGKDLYLETVEFVGRSILNSTDESHETA